MLETCYLEHLILLPCLVELMLLKIGMRVAKFFHFKTFHNLPLKQEILQEKEKKTIKSSKSSRLLFSLQGKKSLLVMECWKLLLRYSSLSKKDRQLKENKANKQGNLLSYIVALVSVLDMKSLSNMKTHKIPLQFSIVTAHYEAKLGLEFLQILVVK